MVGTAEGRPYHTHLSLSYDSSLFFLLLNIDRNSRADRRQAAIEELPVLSLKFHCCNLPHIVYTLAVDLSGSHITRVGV